RPKDRGLPVHPAFCIKPSFDVCWIEPAMSALLREIAHYDVRFPELKIAVLDRGNESVRVQRAILGCFGNTELITRIDPIILQAEFAATSKDFLNVDGIRATPNFQHLDWSSLVRSRYENR